MQLGLTITSISLEGAEALLDAAVAKSVADGKVMVIAVCDAAGNLKAFRRMDGSPNLSVDIAINKAWTASSYGFPTHGWGASSPVASASRAATTARTWLSPRQPSPLSGLPSL